MTYILYNIKKWFVYFSAGIFMFFSWYGERPMKEETNKNPTTIEIIQNTESK